MKQVVLIEIIENGSDVAIFLDGDYIISADPGAGDDTSQIISMANGLAAHFKTELITHEYEASTDWQWDEVKNDLIAKEVILSGDYWDRDDLQFLRFANTINGYEHRDDFVGHVMTELDLEINDVLEILDQAGRTMADINQSLMKCNANP